MHLTQMYETEAKTRWQHIAQVEELSNEVKELREQVTGHPAHTPVSYTTSFFLNPKNSKNVKAKNKINFFTCVKLIFSKSF